MNEIVEYLVVVLPPKPKGALNPRGLTQQSQTYAQKPAPKVQFVKASSPEAAAETVGVKPGARAYVIEQDDVMRFDRAEMAPLKAV
jgi:hypothetical protein